LVASGLKKIGRRTLLKHALIKTNTIGSSYDPLRIHLTQEDGIEGFIVKINDLGVARYNSVLGLLFREPEEKIDIATNICAEIMKARDILLIEDDGSIVTYDGALADWFQQILSRLNCERVLFAIAAMYRLYARNTWNNDAVYFFTVPELSVPERNGLLRRYTELEEIDIGRDDLDWISGLLKGYPDQIFFAVDMIRADGIQSVKDNSHDVIEFSKNRAAVVLRRYENNQSIVDFLRFLAGFEFISYKLINDVVDDEKLTKVVLRRFISESICEEIGATREYIRVSDIIRDYITRSKWQLPEPYISKLRSFTNDYVTKTVQEITDASEYFYYVKSALVSGQPLDERLLIPAHFLTTMRELYDGLRYNEVVRLCDRVLQNASHLDKRAEADIRYYLCQALARLRQPRFLSEVQHIEGHEKNFLLGFYYRMQGRYGEAIDKQLQAMKAIRSERRARRELIILYALMEEWGEALVFARENYNQFPSNPFFVSAYFNCLVQQQPRDRRAELESLIEALDAINSDQAKEMVASARCQLAAVYDGDQVKALKIIDDAIDAFPNNLYPVVTKLDVCVRFRNKAGIERCVNILGKEKGQNKTFYIHLKRGEAILAALNHDIRTAIAIVDREFKHYSARGRDRLIERLVNLGA
jgi:tetratricopeptide (TPR) repeat protein